MVVTTRKAFNRELTRTVQGVPTSPRRPQLTWEEEMTVRMAQGLSEGPDAALAYRGQLHGELRARLGALEAELLASMHQQGPLAETDDSQEIAGVSVNEEVRQRIMDRLAEIARAKKS